MIAKDLINDALRWNEAAVWTELEMARLASAAPKLARMLNVAIEQRDSAVLARYEKTIGNGMINQMQIVLDRMAGDGE